MLTVNLSTPEKVSLVRENVEMVSAMGVDGQFAVLKGHITFLTKIKAGIIKMRTSEETFTVANGPGFFQVANDLVTIITDDAVLPEDANRQKALEARKKAEQTLKQKSDSTDFQKVEAELRKSLLELKLLDYLGK